MKIRKLTSRRHLQKIYSFVFTGIIILMMPGCNSSGEDAHSYNLGSIGAFSEMINAGVKQLALSAPLPPQDMDAFMEEAREVAGRHDVKVYRETDLLITGLFPEDVAEGKDVLVLYQGNTLQAYQTLKADKKRLEEAGKLDLQARQEIARRFGRLLSYSPKKINQLLAANTPFRTMRDFGIRASNLFLYYRDLDKATDFYSRTLGFELLADYGMATILRMTSDSYLILVDATKGMHTAEEPKTVALALLTDQLDTWYDYIKSQNIPIKYDYKPKKGGAHDGFVAIDPEGYLLEFERFKQHPENESFVPALTQLDHISAPSKQETTVPEGLGFNATITWLYYKDILAMQNFYQEALGLEMVADQGWTKIYQLSQSGFIGLVDERRGMHSWTEKKAVNVSVILDDIDGWFEYVNQYKPFELRESEVSTGPEKKYRAFTGYDPEGYYMEFDVFYAHPDNQRIMQYLSPDQ